MKKEPEIYATTFCNMGHRMSDGKPINHECYIIPPRLLRMEREDDPNMMVEWGVWSFGTRKIHKGVKE